jgi:ABC-2 type transport system permease protein
MTAMLQAELIKLRTTRTFLALTAAAVGTSVLITVLVSVLTEPTEESVLTDVFTSDTSALFIMVLAVVGITGEWRHHTITSSLLAAPDRLRFLAAKLVAFAAAGLLLSLLISTAIAVVGFVVLSIRDLPVPEAGELFEQILRNALVAALLGAFGVGIGALVRNQVVAVVGLLVALFLVDSAIGALLPEVGRFSPFSGLPIGITDVPPEDAGLSEDMEILSPGLALLGMLAWIAAAFAAGAALLIRRDLD